MRADPPTSTIGIMPLDQATPILTPSDTHVADHATTEARDEIESVGQGTPTKRKWVDQETIDDEGTETEDEELANEQGAPPSPIEVDYPPMTPRDLLALWPERRRTLAQHAARDGGGDGNDDDIKGDDNAECDWYVQRNVQA
ncbi:hypothetical protein pclt_cds_1201 [Pandoravirus celtis]|nr:hypothetical protein pclt_cds_1201 [Pandoravirus celtis]